VFYAPPSSRYTKVNPDGPAKGALAKAPVWPKRTAGFTIVEVLIASTVLVLTAITVTQALLQVNRQAAISRVMNAAKAEALSRIQQISQCSYSPTAKPPVIPSILTVGTTTQAVDLGSNLTGLGSIPGTATWTVASVSGTTNILSIRCTINYSYLSRNLAYELFTYKSPD
jgi:type II secretory pathway pseudopilin PulG